MSLIIAFPGSRIEPREYVSTEPVECIVCGWTGDAEDHAGDYRLLHGIPRDYLWAMSGDAICHDCTLYCADCGEDLLDGGDFLGCAADAETLLCWFCMAAALCPEATPELPRWGCQDRTIGLVLDAFGGLVPGARRT